MRVAAFLLALAWPGPGAALQQSDLSRARPGDTVIVSPPRSYRAGWLHRFLLGDRNRELWSLPVKAEVLDLSSFEGGLTPTRRGGGLQTPSLRFVTRDGREYRFRSVDKDASQGLDPELRRTIVADVLQDQISSLFPLSAMVVAPLLDAAGVLHADPRLMVMPNDERLGEFREDFAWRLGWMELQPNEGADGAPGFAGSGRVTGSEAFLQRLEESSESRVDAVAFLRARLMDIFVGDWDRHPDQWRWAAFEEGEGLRWEPVPRDRDWALNHIDGLVMRLSRSRWIQFVSFGPEYGSIFGTVWNGRALDRLLLSELTREDFSRVAAQLQERLTDDVIRDAVARLPPAYRSEVGPSLERALRNRRDGLGEVADQYFEILAGWVDVWATDQPELGRVERLPGGRVRVTVTDLGRDRAPASGGPYFERVFHPGETHEVRLFMRAGRDSIEVVGEGGGPIKVRVVGGRGDDVLIDRTSGRDVRFYDDSGNNVFVLGGETGLDESLYVEPQDLESETHRARPRDWGSRWYTFPLLAADSDIGVSAGQTWEWQGYGFRFFPYHSRVRLVYALNPVRLGARATALWELPIGRRGVGGLVELEALTREVRWFYGMGNETRALDGKAFYRADRGYYALSAGLSYRPSGQVSLELTPTVWHSRAVDRDEPTLIGSTRPPSLDAVTQAGVVLRAELDTRDSPVVARSGGRVELEARAVPELLDAQSAYSTVSGRASINFDLGGPVLSFRAGGAHLFGDAPYFEWPQLGGSDVLRGFVEDRFTGRSAAWGGALLRTRVADFFAFFPGTLGASALLDAGRVFMDGEQSSRVHFGYGGGLWISLVRSDLLLNVNAVGSREGTRFYLTFDFPY
jgi:hypothetical protein